MKTFLASLIVTLALLLGNVSSVLAAHFWEVRMSEPKATSQLRTFNLEFVTLSEIDTDSVTVELMQDSSVVASKTTTKAYGDSGMFEVSVPADGTYNYSLKATNSNGGEVKTTSTKAVTVTSNGGTSTVSSSDLNADGSRRATGSSSGQSDENSATAGAETGQVDGGSSDSKDNDEDKSFADRYQWPIGIIGGLAIAAAVYFWVLGGKNPFGPRE